MNFDDIITDLPAVPDADDNRHALRPEPHCREAAAFMFELPEHARSRSTAGIRTS